MSTSTVLIPKRPIGPFRGSVLGFLAGVCTVSAIGFYTLFDKVRWDPLPYHLLPQLTFVSQYTTASASLLQSVEELKANSVHLETYAKRIERLEQQYKQLAATSAKQTELQRVEKDARNLYVSDIRALLARADLGC